MSYDLIKAHKIPVNPAGKVVLETTDGKRMQCEGSIVIAVLQGTKKYKLEATVSSSMKKEMLISYRDLKVMEILPETFPQPMASVQCDNKVWKDERLP